MIHLSVVVVNYNGVTYLEGMILSLLDSLKGKANIQLIIQDNNSKDDSVKVLREIKSKLDKSLDIIVIESKDNVGFAQAINTMIPLAKHERIMILNNDTVVKCLDGCLDFISKNSNYIIAPRLYNTDGSIQKSTFSYPNTVRLVVELFGLKSIAKKILERRFLGGKFDEIRVDYFSGCVLFFEKKLFLKLGGFNVSYYFYHEECDLFIRSETFAITKKLVCTDHVLHYGGGGGSLSDYSYIAYYTNLCRLYMEHGGLGRLFYWFVFMFVFCIQYVVNFAVPIALTPFQTVYKGSSVECDRNSTMMNNKARFKMIMKNVNHLVRGEC